MCRTLRWSIMKTSLVFRRLSFPVLCLIQLIPALFILLIFLFRFGGAPPQVLPAYYRPYRPHRSDGRSRRGKGTRAGCGKSASEVANKKRPEVRDVVLAVLPSFMSSHPGNLYRSKGSAISMSCCKPICAVVDTRLHDVITMNLVIRDYARRGDMETSKHSDGASNVKPFVQLCRGW